MTGDNGSRADARAKSGMGYASYRPSLPWFIDMVSGYQRISFQLRRFVTGSGDMLEAPRDGTQAFSSWSGGYEKKGEKWMFSTYGRMDVAEEIGRASCRERVCQYVKISGDAVKLNKET